MTEENQSETPGRHAEDTGHQDPAEPKRLDQETVTQDQPPTDEQKDSTPAEPVEVAPDQPQGERVVRKGVEYEYTQERGHRQV